MITNEISPIPSHSIEIAKSNILIGAKYRSTLLENKILLYSLSKIQQAKEEKDGTIVSEIKVAELKRLLGVKKSHSFYDKLEPVAKSLTGKKVGMTNPEQKTFDYMAVVIRSTYKDGILTIKYNPDLKPYIYDIDKNFTLLNIETMFMFKSVFSFRLYELLKSKAYIPKGYTKSQEEFRIRFTLSELKLNLGIVNAELDSVQRILSNKKNPDFDKAVEASPEKVFDDWVNFKRRVLECAKKEINDKTEMHVEYETLKSGIGGKIYAIDFLVKPNLKNIPEETKELSEEDKIAFIDQISDLIDEPLKYKDLKVIADAADYSYSKVEKAYGIVKTSPNDIENLVGFLVSAIKKGFEEPVKVKKTQKKNTFNDFEQREIDFGQLEKELLSYH